MPLRFTLRQLEYLVAVGEAGSIAQASARINVSSPSISAAISQLEAEFGTPLFVRQHAQGLSLTPGGQRICDEARRILDSAASLNDLANDIIETARGPISIGVLSTIAPLVSASLRRSFEAAYPDANVTLREAHQVELFRMLGRAEIDIALTYDLDIPKDVAFDPMLSLPPMVMVPADHRLASRATVQLSEFADEPMVLLDLPLSRDYFLAMFQKEGIRPHIAERTPQLSVARSLVANGFGFGMINIRTKTRAAPDGEPLAFLAIEGDHGGLWMGLATKKSVRQPRIVSAFHDHLRHRIETTGLPGMS